MATVAALSNGRASLIKRVEALVNLSQQARVHETVRGEFFIRAADLNHIVAQFEQRQLQIVELCTTPEQLDEQYEVQSRFDDMQYSIKSVAAELNREAAQSSAPRGNLTSNNVKLPKIQIPTFDGQIKNWPTFYDLFRSLIHNNPNLSAIEKFQYLSTSLSREASTVIKNLPISAANYAIAFDALVARYNNKRVLLTNYWQAIYSAPKVNGDSPSLLRNLLNVFSENLAALKQYDEVDLWDFTLLNLMLQKLDTTWKQKFELSIVGNSVPAYNDLQEFLLKHCTALETSVMTMGHNSASALHKPTAASSVPAKRPVTSSFVTRSPISKEQCLNCSDEHPLTKCDAFLEMEPRNRHTFARKKNLCYNCLSTVHSVSKCPSKLNCRVCDCRHHTLLHFVPKPSTEPEDASGIFEDPSVDDGVKVMTNAIATHSFTLLATARIIVVDSRGKYRAFRALLDTASEATFVTERCAKVLGLPQTNAVVPIQGLNQMSSSSTSGVLKCEVRSHLVRHFSLKAEMVVVPQICGDVPTRAVSQDRLRQFRHIRNLKLADPEFGTPQQVDVLLGADVYGQIVTSGFKKGRLEEPSALNTVFGWVLIGGIKRNKQKTVVRSFCTSIDNSLDAALKRFGRLEQVPQCSMAAPQDAWCEEKVTSAIACGIQGSYNLQLPFADTTPSLLGRSSDSAVRRFLVPESRLFAADLLSFARETLKGVLNTHRVCAWPDSRVTLTGIKSRPGHGTTFVANQIAPIQGIFEPSAWNHGSGPDKPADCASRGLLLQERVTHPLWWADAMWLTGTAWPLQVDLEVPTGTELELHRRELHHALLIPVRMVQSKVFANEVRSLQKNGTCSKPFHELTPFLDDGLIRVTGRLHQTELLYETKHPLLLPRSHSLTELIIEAAHRKHLHVGFRTLQYLLLQAAAGNCTFKWHFNPPSAHHMGGLWEPGVKSFKSHLKRVVGEQPLTLEEFSTVLAQIEAVLNSRPLCPASADNPDEPLETMRLNRLSRWQLVQRLHQDVWHKWNTSNNLPSVGALVVFKGDSVAPLQWQLGRIVALHPGKDGIVRVAQVRTTCGMITRPRVKLCPLPRQ
ncbi:hypothetical protein Zmor_005766 [Zophobas morio]|uniref:DUF5641 domain-containing protein n=1 Tax=Zophobas morio TaxID=2755281 RepID=A0AA38ITT7_9CUCU|nr:hypothetical protein Zmor_005766 [Zophobas morio]